METDTVTLGQLIDSLAAADPDTLVPNGFGEANSWRGMYAHIAFEPRTNARLGDMLDEARSAVGKIFEGFKGGDFLMSRSTPCHIAPYGQYGDDDDDGLTPARLAAMLSTPIATITTTQ